MKFNTFIKAVFLFIAITLVSCASRKNVVYLQNADSQKNTGELLNYEPRLQKDDQLSIIISGDEPEATYPFNMPQIQGNYQINENQDGIKTYLIDAYGDIQFPVVGKIHLGGLTRTEAVAKIESEVKPFLTTAKVNLRILNYKVSIMGEVNRPGTVKLGSERITLLEALSQSGDLTIYGKRNNILIIRESDGKRTYNRVDITKADFVDSPYYYLSQNDVVVVEPNRTKINASVIGPDVAALISALSVLVSLTILLTR